MTYGEEWGRVRGKTHLELRELHGCARVLCRVMPKGPLLDLTPQVALNELPERALRGRAEQVVPQRIEECCVQHVVASEPVVWVGVRG